MREASSRHEDVLASRKAVDAEVRRLQQLADTERRVEILGDRLAREQAFRAAPGCARYVAFLNFSLTHAPFGETL